jgi:cyclic-di-AMP phosphodiesterase PgpH
MVKINDDLIKKIINPLGERKMSDRESNSPESKTQNLDKVRLFLNLAFILFVFLVCYVEEIYLFFRPPQTGETAFLTFRSQSYFAFDQGKIYESLRDDAIGQHSPIYTYVPETVTPAKKKIEAFLNEIAKFKSQGRAGRGPLILYFKKEYGVGISPEEAERLLRYPDLQNLLSGILTIQESILQSKIAEDLVPLQGKTTVQVLYKDPIGKEIFHADEITNLEKARLSLQEKVQQLFWHVDPRILTPLLQISLSTLQPNLRYDQKINDTKIEELVQQYPATAINYKPGDILVPFRKVMDRKDVLLLAASREAERKDLYGRLPWVLFVTCFSVLLYNLFLEKLSIPCWRTEPPYRLFLLVLALTVLISKAGLLFTPFPVYVVPFAVLPLLLVLLHRERISISFATALGAILISLFAGRNLLILLFFTFGGLVAILASFRIRKRSQILILSLIVGAINAAVVLIALAGSGGLGQPPQNADFYTSLLSLAGWALAGGLAAGPLVLLFLPLIELSWHNASAFKLNKYSDLEHPLMIELLTKAPGTYQHSMSVAHLAYALGEAIGANSLLLRVGAYYHDIGKTAHPEFYVENLFGRKNPHDALSAFENTKIIMDHVKIGKKIALEAGLPEVIADFIPQHHGTLLIEYFYDKAVKENPEAVISQKDFRYAGPKPQSVEAAILMICDAVEATSRTIEEPTREKIEAMIRHFIVNRFNDGQFDECNLSTRELAKIVTVLVHTLEASLHRRVEYPWQQKEKNRSQKEDNNKDSIELPAPINVYQD